MKRVADWIEERVGIVSAIRHFLQEDVPASSGWHQVPGSVAIFLFLLQMLTGTLLSLNYAPTPGEAYDSLRFIVTQLTGGQLLRGLHHWGASAMIVVVVLHMIQVFLWGAYKRPREATWLVGVVLLLLTLTYGLTGYLLPWDNRAYWGTVVTTQIAGRPPLVGPLVVRVLGGEGPVGAVTFARFYGIHVLVLPPITLALIALHVYLVRRHGVTQTPEDEFRPLKKFYPSQAVKDTVAIFVVFAALFITALLVRIPIERIADATDHSYIPRPEWYFLFLFQLLKIFDGPLEIVGSVILPTVAVMALFLVPLADRGKLIRVTRRTGAMGVLAFAAFGWIALMVAAIASTPPEQGELIDHSRPTGWLKMSPEDLAGVGYARAPKSLTEKQQKSYERWLARMTPLKTEALQSAPDYAAAGAVIYQRHFCGTCHQVNGAGTTLGPPLDGLGKRRSRQWVERHFVAPKELSPNTVMPVYEFNPTDMRNITSYLMALE